MCFSKSRGRIAWRIVWFRMCAVLLVVGSTERGCFGGWIDGSCHTQAVGLIWSPESFLAMQQW